MNMSIELKYSWRMLLKKPLYTTLTVLIVAIGLGLTVYSYSLLSNLVFKPLYLNGDAPIVALEGPFDHNHLYRTPVDPYHVNLAAEQLDIFDQYGFYGEASTMIGGTSSEFPGLLTAVKVNATSTSWNVFELAGVQPLIGRGFNQDDFVEGAEPVVVLGYDVWQNYFNGDADVINKTLAVDAIQTRIIGVLTDGFAFPEMAEIWRPLGNERVMPTEASYSRLFAFARLKQGVSMSSAQAGLDGFNKELATTIDERFRFRIRENDKYLQIKPYKQATITQYFNVFIALFIVVFLILVLACINVGNLLLARVNERIKEVAIRIALGIPRKKLVLQMLWESIFICTIGGVLALLFAAYGAELTNQMLDATFAVNNQKPFWWTVEIDLSAIAILITSIVLMVLITGYIPAKKALNSDVNAAIRDGTRGALGKSAAFKGKVLVTSEIFLSCIVLIMATILLSTGYFASKADYGVETESRITAQLNLPSESYPVRWGTEFEYQDRLQRGQVFTQIKAQVDSVNGFVGSSIMTELPGRGEGTSYFEIEGRAAPVYNENPYSNNEVVARGSWDALGMKIVQGRDFDHRDSEKDVYSIIINESIANTFFPDGDAVGQRVRRVRRTGASEIWWTIVGVVSDTFHGSTMRSSSASFNSYHVQANSGIPRMHIAIHHNGSAAHAEAQLRRAVADVDPNVGVFHVQSYDSLIQQPMLLLLAVSKIFLLCGVIAAILAASGIYAMASNNILQRTQEIGVRRALGAPDKQIMLMFFKQAGGQLLIGLAVGIATAIALTSYMSNALVINSQSYGVALVGVPVLIIIMVLLATYLPIRSILKLEPSDALHYD